MASRTARELGRHYTPHTLAQRMVRSALASLSGELADQRILDPACGDGAFLLAVFDQLCEAHAAANESSSLEPSERLAIVEQQLFGVDLDAPAVESLRGSLLERIGATGKLLARAQEVLEANFRIGDALLGNGFENSQVPPSLTAELPSCGIDWSRDFPAPCRAEGFDLVIGNPPYLRERDAKPLFDRLAATPLGQRWRQARMDLWYYFVHRSLDLLRPGGVLSFVVNSYWTASHGASRLIERLKFETIIEEIEDLGNGALFTGVAGRHLVFRLRKRSLSAPESLADESGPCRVILPQHDSSISSSARQFHLAQVDLFDSGRLVLSPPDRLSRQQAALQPLSAGFDTRQGIAENPPRINRRVLVRFGDHWPLAAGVFVLHREELQQLPLNTAEQSLLRPYFDTVDVGRYVLCESSQQTILYLTKRTAPTLEQLPAVAAHLSRFRPILAARREVECGICAWWHLHWPRVEALFVEPRILCVQMGRRPQFVYAQRPTFVGFSVNLIVPKTGEDRSLPALTGILNSDLARAWFERHAKHRGVHLEINGHVLRRFPLPLPDAKHDRELAQLVLQRQSLPAADEEKIAQLELEIEELVTDWYAASDDCR